MYKNWIIISIIISIITLITVFVIYKYSYNKTDIAICMWYDDGIKEYADLAKKINQRYCDIHGYDLILDDTIRLPNRAKQWEKISYILNLLNTTKYEYIIWIDADACFNLNNPDKYILQNIIEKYKDKDIIFSGDLTMKINTGFFIIKNTQYSKNLLNNIINSNIIQCKLYKETYHEQTCLSHLYETNIYDLKNNSVIIPYGKLQVITNSYINTNLEEHKDSLVYHYAAEKKEYRINKLNENIKEYNINEF